MTTNFPKRTLSLQAKQRGEIRYKIPGKVIATGIKDDCQICSTKIALSRYGMYRR
jgi:hypothetical protein